MLRLMAYGWALPNTVMGILLGLAMLALGGRVRLVMGVAEFHGGWAVRSLAARPALAGFCAMTLGHVILGTCPSDLAAWRAHEHVHVRQYERWGIFFLPAYVLSSIWQVMRGRHGYRDNVFERQAYAVDVRRPA